MLRILYLLIGPSPALRTQCEYAVLSALAFGGAHCPVHVFTDATGNPSADAADTLKAFAQFIHLEDVPLGAKDRGPFEVKLAVLADAAARFPGDDLLFADADTFFTHDLSPVRLMLAQGHCLLHRPEYPVLAEPGPQMRKFRRALARASWPLAAADMMWNSGAIGVPAGQSARIHKAQQGMARLLPFTGHRKYLAEQFAVSCALPDARRADDVLFHYWYQKQEYTAAIAARLAAWGEFSVPEKVQALREAGPIQLPAPCQKIHWWERALIAARLRRMPTDPRGLPPEPLSRGVK